MSKAKNLSDLIAKDISRVAKSLGVPPYAMTKAKYFSQNPKFSEWELRKVGGFTGIRNTYFEYSEERDEASVVESAELRSAYRKLRKEQGQTDLLMRRIEEVVAKMPKMKATPYKAKGKPKKQDKRTLSLVLSDLHFGSDLTMAEHKHNFGPIEEARALAYVVENVCSYKLEHRENTELVVNILGDIIENELHGSGSMAPIHLQTARAIWLLMQAVTKFSENFPSVVVNFAVGNHGRDIAVHKSRATDSKWNAVESTIYYAIKMACKGLKNVTFNQPLTPWVEYAAQGHNVYATHGDTNLNPGNVGSKIDVSRIEGQINKINASLNDNEEYSVFVVGHVHQALMTALSNGAYFIANGALTPPNGYAQSLNIMESQQIQVMFETTPEHAVGDFRFIRVEGYEKRSALDKIIQPFKGLEYM